MNVNFVTSFKKNIVTHSCRLCSIKFSFKNKLFAHLREECWKSSSFSASVSSSSASMMQLKSKKTKLIEFNRRLIQSSVSLMKFIDHVFRECHYAIIKVKCSVIEKLLKICVNIDCSIIMKDKQRYKKNIQIVLSSNDCRSYRFVT